MTEMALRGSRNLPPFDVAALRAEFPILTRQVNGKPLVFLDSGASAQKPRAVIDGMAEMMRARYANVHRGIHTLSQEATDDFEAARATFARFLNAGSEDEIVITRSVTEAINLVAYSYGRASFGPGDEILVSEMEHHANIVPWQLVADQVGATVRAIPITDIGELRLDALADMLGPKTRMVAVTHVSNVLGTVNPVAEIVRLAHGHGVPVLLDGAQAVVHGPVDVQALDVDFYGFTGHKLYGPNAIGVLYGKKALLDLMPPWQGGGDMIERVSFAGTSFKAPPHRFEAGTPPIVEAVGLDIAIDFVGRLGWEAIAAHEQSLLAAATEQLTAIDGLRILGTAPEKAAIVSFVIDGVHAMDLAMLLDRAGVAVRVGQHCAEPLMQRLGVESTVRASFAAYNTLDEVDVLADAVARAVDRLR
ncbi:MAG: aminotransferase class V-fold PLP-dependent enzyme [Alphaproteobacteria bacterium]